MKKRLSIFMLLIVIIAFSLGCAQDNEQPKELLSTDDVTKALDNASVRLEECYRINSEDFILNGVAPTICEVARNREDHVFIYIFDKYMNRGIAAEEYWRKRDEFRNKMKPYIGENLAPIRYEAKNALVFYLIKDEQYYPKPFPREIILTNLAMNNLKELKTIVFTGESEHWLGKITLKYYENILYLSLDGQILDPKDCEKAGAPRVDSDSAHLFCPLLTYRKADIYNVDQIYLHVDVPRGSFGGSEQLFNKYTTPHLGGFGGSGRGATEEDILVMTVRWNGNEEVIDLKAE